MDDQAVIRTYGNTNLPEGTEDRPLVTFALFAYNQEKYVREAVEGAFSQTYSPLEIILSDDCSSDRTFEIMEEMAREYKGPHLVKVNRMPSNSRMAGHINHILSLSRGEIVSWAAGDDIALPERTERFVAMIASDKAVVAAHSDIVEIDLQGSIIRSRQHDVDFTSLSLERAARTGNSVITQSHAFKRTVFEKFGPFRSDLTQEGIAMCFRETSMGKILFTEETLTKYRIGSGTSTYEGRDIRRLKFDEPIKFTNWYLSAFRQMKDDSLRLDGETRSRVIRDIDDNIAFYSNLLSVNQGTSFLRPIIENLLARPKDMTTIRAAFRRLLPLALYAKLAK